MLLTTPHELKKSFPKAYIWYELTDSNSWSENFGFYTEDLNPKNLIPVHTQNAKVFMDWSKNVTLLTNVGDSYTI
jgi:hypothetical protein